MTEDNSTGFTLVVAVSLHVRIWEVFWCVFPPNCHTPLNDEQCVMWLHSLQHWTCDHLTFLQSLIFFVFWPYYHSLSNYNHSGTFCFVFWPCHVTLPFCETLYNHFQYCHSVKQFWIDCDMVDPQRCEFAEQQLANTPKHPSLPNFNVNGRQHTCTWKTLKLWPQIWKKRLLPKEDVCVCVCVYVVVHICVWFCMVLHPCSLLHMQTQSHTHTQWHQHTQGVPGH